VEHNGDFYKATTIKELETIVSEIKIKKSKKQHHYEKTYRNHIRRIT